LRDYSKSIALSERSKHWTPFGSQTLSKASCRFPEGVYPPVLVRGEGPRVWDADGNEFIDLICSLGATAIGYGHPRVTDAMKAQIDRGPLFSLPNPLEGQVAERFCKLLGWPMAAKFAKTGSDACSMAVRAARAYAGRNVVLVADNGYHGTHDWFTVLRDQHPGVPEWMNRGVRTFAYNDLFDLQRKLSDSVWKEAYVWTDEAGTHGETVPTAHPIALVMIEPTLFMPPAAGFLQGVVDLAHQHGALVCFDETILGGRMALGGGGEYFGVVPDLAVYGKALGGGYPIACVAGAADVIAGAVGYSGTFFGDCIGLAAMDATLDAYEQEPIIARQWEAGTAIMAHLGKTLNLFCLPGVVDGYAIHPRLTFTGDGGRYRMSLFLQEMAENGVLWHPAGINIPGRLTDAELQQVLTAIRLSLYAIAKGSTLRGAPIQDVQIRGRKAVE
jgi:glutamate-1-semialdehyde 2,1-aminomutase